VVFTSTDFGRAEQFARHIRSLAQRWDRSSVRFADRSCFGTEIALGHGRFYCSVAVAILALQSLVLVAQLGLQLWCVVLCNWCVVPAVRTVCTCQALLSQL
jgi:hypothetical protein